MYGYGYVVNVSRVVYEELHTSIDIVGVPCIQSIFPIMIELTVHGCL